MNTENFVTYEQALRLKELGFDEKVLYYYDEYKRFRSSSTVSFGICSVYDLYSIFKKSEPEVAASTLAQAQKWLREKGYFVLPSLYMIGKIWECNILDSDRNIHRVTLSSSYESALSAGITKCLELLEK